MFDFDNEKKIRELVRKFNLTKKEAEGFLEHSKELFEIKRLSDRKKFKKILILLIILLGIILIIWLYDKHERPK